MSLGQLLVAVLDRSRPSFINLTYDLNSPIEVEFISEHVIVVSYCIDRAHHEINILRIGRVRMSLYWVVGIEFEKTKGILGSIFITRNLISQPSSQAVLQTS